MIKPFKFSKIQFLLIGEIHGIHENINVLKIFVNAYFSTNKRFAIGFEWPSALSDEINQYILGEVDKLSWKKWKFVNDKDGRISKEHIAFLSWLRKKNLAFSSKKRILVICFDENSKQWNERDKRMSQNLEKAKMPVIAIMGNLHAQRTKFNFEKEKYTPIGFHLSGRNMIAIKINYLSGKFYNYGIKKIQRTKGIKLGLIKNDGNDFDYFYVVKEAHPIGLLAV